VRCEDGCTSLNERLTVKLEGDMRDPQRIQILVPLRYLSLNPNVCGLRRCLSVGYRDEEIPLEESIFLDIWDINSSKD
jgi:hypothetical protein